jgi:hypothetical protein
LEQLGVDIVHDKAFSYRTKVYKASVVELRHQGLGTVQHHTAITKADMSKLYSGQLSKRYTNHSVRSTAITVLDEAGGRFLIFINESTHIYT